MKKINFIVNMFIPVLWIIIFFFAKDEAFGIDYGDVYTFFWIAIPIGMFVFNTFTEKKIKKLALLYLVSAGMQILGIFIQVLLHYNFISGDPGTSAVGQLIMLITAILNLVLSLMGIVIKSLILRLKKQ
ncbi:MAG: hypothetical protein IJB80_05685 [Clostridia bacterium]|nr:hypothetical protein [Clostridia bacterium]